MSEAPGFVPESGCKGTHSPENPKRIRNFFRKKKRIRTQRAVNPEDTEAKKTGEGKGGEGGTHYYNIKGRPPVTGTPDRRRSRARGRARGGGRGASRHACGSPTWKGPARPPPRDSACRHGRPSTAGGGRAPGGRTGRARGGQGHAHARGGGREEGKEGSPGRHPNGTEGRRPGGGGRSRRCGRRGKSTPRGCRARGSGSAGRGRPSRRAPAKGREPPRSPRGNRGLSSQSRGNNGSGAPEPRSCCPACRPRQERCRAKIGFFP